MTSSTINEVKMQNAPRRAVLGAFFYRGYTIYKLRATGDRGGVKLATQEGLVASDGK